MEETVYWVEITQVYTHLGAGFLLTPYHALTALHCLRHADLDGPPLELRLADDVVIEGRVVESAPGADLALIELLRPCHGSFTSPGADWGHRGDPWFVPYRPRTSDPYLSGDVVSGSAAYWCEAGDEIKALQLGCAQHLGDYSGYSGSPVERRITDGEPALLGVLLEQSPDRHAAGRASDVLWAITIAEALQRFSYCGFRHLLKMLTADPLVAKADYTSPKPADSDPTGTTITQARALVDLFREWAGSGVLNPGELPSLGLRIANQLVDGFGADHL
jgi:hypothetical protein